VGVPPPGGLLNISRRKERINVTYYTKCVHNWWWGLCQRETTRSRCHTFRDICERNREDATKRTGGTRRTGIRPPSQTPATTELENQMISLPTVFLFSLSKMEGHHQTKTLGDIILFFIFSVRKDDWFRDMNPGRLPSSLLPSFLFYCCSPSFL
jgi:hypothetical protein